MNIWFILLLVLICALQGEVVYLYNKLQEIEKTLKTTGQWVLDLDKKLDKKFDEIDKALNEPELDLMEFINSNNPYQE
jgi:hypothetical protein